MTVASWATWYVEAVNLAWGERDGAACVTRTLLTAQAWAPRIIGRCLTNKTWQREQRRPVSQNTTTSDRRTEGTPMTWPARLGNVNRDDRFPKLPPPLTGLLLGNR